MKMILCSDSIHFFCGYPSYNKSTSSLHCSGTESSTYGSLRWPFKPKHHVPWICFELVAFFFFSAT